MNPKRYRVADIAMDEDGKFWFQVIGDCCEQGGPSLGWMAYGTGLEGGFQILEKKLVENKDTYLELIKAKKGK